MQIRQITDGYAVSPQIAPQDAEAIRAAGFTTVINNRPDAEIPPALGSRAMREAIEAAGLAYVEIPFSHQAFSADLVTRQQAAIAAAAGPVLAYCASGNRCTVLWALGAAAEGRMTADEILAAAAAQGYDLSGLRPQIETAARG